VNVYATLTERNVTDIASQHHHNKDEAGDHWPQINLACYSEEVAVKIGKNEHHRDNAIQQINVEPLICPVHSSGIGKSDILDCHNHHEANRVAQTHD